MASRAWGSLLKMITVIGLLITVSVNAQAADLDLVSMLTDQLNGLF